jgi:RHS repeat-associated protein
MTSYEYDDAGNLLEIVVTDDSGSTTDTRTYNNLNQIETRTGGWTYAFDDNGCLLEKNNGTGVGDEKWEFSWDEDDRLVQVKKGVYAAGPVLVNQFTVDYTYDSAGRMLTRDDGTDVTTFVWDGWDLLSETTDSVTTDYLVPQGLIHSFIRDGELFVCHADALGSVRMVTDANGDVVAQLEYGAWGELLDGSFDSVPGGMPFGFVGAFGVRTDATTGLLYMRARHYDCTLARFISRDALKSVNRYEYALSSPLDLVDLSGLEPDTPAGGERITGDKPGIWRLNGGYHNYGGKPIPKKRKKRRCEWELDLDPDWTWKGGPIAWPTPNPTPSLGPIPDITPLPPIHWDWPQWGPIRPDPNYRHPTSTKTRMPQEPQKPSGGYWSDWRDYVANVEVEAFHRREQARYEHRMRTEYEAGTVEPPLPFGEAERRQRQLESAIYQAQMATHIVLNIALSHP